MDLDLGQALHDAARNGTAHRPAIEPAPVLHRIRRRRTARHAIGGTLGAAAVGALALGATQLTGLREIAPAAPTSTSTGTPAPTASPSEAGPWPAVALAGEVVCGAPLADVVDPDGDADLRLEPGPTPDARSADRPDGAALTATRGEPLTVDVQMVNGTDRDLDAVAASPARVWFVQDGAVVGRLDAARSTDEPGRYVAGPRSSVSGGRLGGVPVDCPADGVPTPLGAGEYAVYVVQDLGLAGGTTLRVTGHPATVTVDEPADRPADPHPALGELEVSPAGLGPLTVGLPPDDNPGAAMIEWDPDACAGFDGEPGRWVASGYPDEMVDGGPRAPFTVAADEEAVRWIDVRTPAVRTAQGVGIGATLADLRSAYPQLEGPFDGAVSRVWWLPGATGTLVLETQGDEHGLQPAGTPETVVLLRVLAAGIDPAFATANTDQVAGGCL